MALPFLRDLEEEGGVLRFLGADPPERVGEFFLDPDPVGVVPLLESNCLGALALLVGVTLLPLGGRVGIGTGARKVGIPNKSEADMDENMAFFRFSKVLGETTGDSTLSFVLDLDCVEGELKAEEGEEDSQLPLSFLVGVKVIEWSGVQVGPLTGEAILAWPAGTDFEEVRGKLGAVCLAGACLVAEAVGKYCTFCTPD